MRHQIDFAGPMNTAFLNFEGRTYNVDGLPQDIRLAYNAVYDGHPVQWTEYDVGLLFSSESSHDRDTHHIVRNGQVRLCSYDQEPDDFAGLQWETVDSVDEAIQQIMSLEYNQ